MTGRTEMYFRRESPTAPDAVASYVEAGAARNRLLLALGLAAPVLICATCAALALMVSTDWLVGLLLTPLMPPFLMYIPILYRNWPSGIRIDKRGVQIGAIASVRAADRVPSCAGQAWGLFHAPWSEIASIEVVDDPRRLRQLRTSSGLRSLCNRWSLPRSTRYCKIGVLLPPFTRAALVITVWTGQVRAPATRPVTFFRAGPLGGCAAAASRGSRSQVTGELSGVWIAPTRHPEALRAALTAWRKHAPAADPARSALD